jgi:hypothetical protein
MSSCQNWLANTPLGSAAKSFLAFVIGAAVADWATKGSIDFSSAQTWVIGGFVTIVPPLVAWLNPADHRFGNGSASAE